MSYLTSIFVWSLLTLLFISFLNYSFRVVGTLENASGVRPLGVTLAVTKCRLHLLTFETLESLEEEHPILVLKLYKMLSHLMARREEITVEHLSTLHNILSSPAHSKPIFHRVASNNALKSLSRA